jgi:hypothetical protein
MKRHCPKNKEYIAPFKNHLIEGTMGNLTQEEKDEICKSIQEGFMCGHIMFGTYSLSFNTLTTRHQIN